MSLVSTILLTTDVAYFLWTLFGFLCPAGLRPSATANCDVTAITPHFIFLANLFSLSGEKIIFEYDETWKPYLLHHLFYFTAKLVQPDLNLSTSFSNRSNKEKGVVLSIGWEQRFIVTHKITKTTFLVIVTGRQGSFGWQQQTNTGGAGANRNFSVQCVIVQLFIAGWQLPTYSHLPAMMEQEINIFIYWWLLMTIDD